MKLVFTLLAAVSAVTLRVNPVEKVVEILAKLQGEVEAEGKAEAAAYDKFACFCKDQASDKQYAIEKYESKEALLKAQIEQKNAERSALDEEVAEHKAEIASHEAMQEEVSALRATERDGNTARSAQLGKAIKAMKGAIESLKASKDGMVDAKTSLVSKYSELIKNSAILAEAYGLMTQSDVLSLIQQPDTAHAYSYHSNEIIGTLESLLKQFKNKKIQLDNEEMSLEQDYQMASGARRNQIESLNKSATEKAQASASLSEEVAEHETVLQETEYSHSADNNFLQDLVGKCEQKAKDFDQRSSARTAELTAISKALELLKGDVSNMYGSNDLGLAAKQAEVKQASLVTTKASVQKAADATDSGADDFEPDLDDGTLSFVQIGDSRKNDVLRFLSDKADALGSISLSTLVVQLRDAPSPFAKVKQMIGDLVTRLENEAKEEASQKAWCDEEMANAQGDRDEAQRAVEGLRATLTEKNALVDKLTEEIGELAQEIADATKALNEATELRNTEQATNEQTIADGQAGLEALQGALGFLRDFYGGGAKALLQQKPSNANEGYERFVAEGAGADGKTVDDMAPDAGGVSGEYHGKADAATGIIGLLEVIESDFEHGIESTQSEEDAAAAAFATLKEETEIEIQDKSDLKGTKESEKDTANLDITQADADMKTQQKTLQLALDELLKLKPVCVDTGASWEERSARRKQEIDSLKEALKILQNTKFAFLAK